MVASITFVSGVFFALLAVFKMGWISQFLSKAVIVGFLFGAGIQTTIGELAKITGTKASGDNSWQKLASWIGSLDDTHGTTVVVGVVSLVVIFGLRFVAPKVPGALVLVVGGLLASALLGLEGRGVALVGEVLGGELADRRPPQLRLYRRPLGRRPHGRRRAPHDRLLADRGRRSHVRRADIAIRSTSTRSRWPRAWPTWLRAGAGHPGVDGLFLQAR